MGYLNPLSYFFNYFFFTSKYFTTPPPPPPDQRTDGSPNSPWPLRQISRGRIFHHLQYHPRRLQGTPGRRPSTPPSTHQSSAQVPATNVSLCRSRRWGRIYRRAALRCLLQFGCTDAPGSQVLQALRRIRAGGRQRMRSARARAAENVGRNPSGRPHGLLPLQQEPHL